MVPLHAVVGQVTQVTVGLVSSELFEIKSYIIICFKREENHVTLKRTGTKRERKGPNAEKLFACWLAFLFSINLVYFYKDCHLI